MPASDLPDNFYERIKPRLHERIGRQLRLAGTVMDLGCGSCDLVRYLAETYHQKVVGIDISARSFPKGRHTHGGVRFRCLARDARHIDSLAGQSVDAGVTMWALHEMKHPRTILAEVHRILRPGGEMLIVEFPKGSLAQKLWNEAYFTLDEIEDMLARAGFENVQGKLIEKGQIAWAIGLKPTDPDVIAKASSGVARHGLSKATRG